MEITINDFSSLFKEKYPNDWDRINRIYEEQEEKRKSSKKAPMPHPEKYIQNMYKIYMKKHN